LYKYKYRKDYFHIRRNKMAVITNFGVPITGGSAESSLMPKLQYRFRVTFSGLGTTTDGMPTVTQNVISAQRPSVEHEEVTLDAYNSKIRMLGKHTWQDVQIVLRDDVTGAVAKAIGEQLQKQVDHGTQTTRRAGADYKFSMKIQTLDGQNGADAQGEDGDHVLDTWELVGCYLPSVQYGDLNYSSSEMVQITMTVRYDNASHSITGSEVLGVDGGSDFAGAGVSVATRTN
jgi:hypothetical protein